MDSVTAVIRKKVLVINIQSDVVGAWQLTMTLRGGTKLCNIPMIVGLRPPLKRV